MQIDPHYRSCHVVRESSIWHYKADADICRGSLERRHQTTVGSRVNERAAVAC